MNYKLLKTVVIIILFFSQLTWSQILKEECIAITEDVIKEIETNDIEDALSFFSNPSEETKNEVKKAILRMNSLNSLIITKSITSSTKSYFIDRRIYRDSNDEINLALNFYYRKNSKEQVIERIQVRDKYYFESLTKRNNTNRQKSYMGGPPPPNK